MKNFEIEFLNTLKKVFKAPVEITNFAGENDCNIHVLRLEFEEVKTENILENDNTILVIFELAVNVSCGSFYIGFLTQKIREATEVDDRIEWTSGETIEVAEGKKNRIATLSGAYRYTMDPIKFTNRKIKNINMEVIVKEHE